MRVRRSLDGQERLTLSVPVPVTREQMALALALNPRFFPDNQTMSKLQGLELVRLTFQQDSAAVWDDPWGLTAPTPVATDGAFQALELRAAQTRYAAALAHVNKWCLFSRSNTHRTPTHHAPGRGAR